MTAVIVCCIISIVNILLWLFFFGQYKRRFSPGKILSDIRSEVNKLLVEINWEADRSITLIDARRKGLQKLLDEAKRYTNIASGELDKRNRSQDLQSALTRQSSEIRNSTGNSSLYSFPSDSTPLQRDLFSDTAEPVLSVLEQDTTEPIQLDISEESKRMQVPEVIYSPDPVKSEKDIRTKVLELSAEGFAAEMIAAELGVSITEVQLIINMYGI